MGPDSQWDDTLDGFGVSGVHKIQWSSNYFLIVGIRYNGHKNRQSNLQIQN